MKSVLVGSLAYVLCAGAPAFAWQAVAPAAGVAPTVIAATGAAIPDANGMYKLREGEDVSLTFAQDLSSKTSSDGDPVTLVLVDDLKVGGVVVARAGAKATGEVTNSKRAGIMGKAGELNMRLNYLKVGDNKIHLRGTRGKEGQSGQTGAIVLTVLFGPIGLIKHGKEVEIKQGTALKAFVSDDIPLPPAPPAGS